jgi:phage tail sheath protein FI
VSVSNPFLADIQARRGLTGFLVVCDERNNTPERIDRNELHVAFFLKPTRAAEFIQLNLVVLRSEASFTADEVLAAGGLVLASNNG